MMQKVFIELMIWRKLSKMSNFIKKLFCNHKWKLIDFYHGSSRISTDGNYYNDTQFYYKSVVFFGRVNHYKCIKCGKEYHKFIGGFKGLK